MTGEETATSRVSRWTDSRRMKASTIDVAGLDGGFVRLTAEQLDGLESRVGCPVLRAGDAGWDDAVLVWNGMVAKAPALVLQPTSAAHVGVVVGFARDHGLLLSIKGGGHNMAGTSIAERGLTLDMSRRRDVSVEPDASACARRLWVPAPGRRSGHAGARTGHAVGLVRLGGRRRRSDARRRPGLPHASLRLDGGQPCGGRDRHRGRPDPDGRPGRERRPLLGSPGRWGNFGVVTRFTYRLHEVGPTITGGLIVWSADWVDDVLAAYRDLTESAPRELTAPWQCAWRRRPRSSQRNGTGSRSSG